MRYWVNHVEGWIGTTPDSGEYRQPAEEITKEEYDNYREEIENV